MTADEAASLGLEVPVGSIDGELRKLWEADEASTNASLMNLALYSEDPESLVKNSEAAQQLTREHACRALLIAMDRDAPETGIRSWITAHCHLAHGKKSVCCEQLAFLLSGKAVGRLRNTVFAHMASDLPLVFWWLGELSSFFEERLYRMIDRLIVDSTSWADPLAGFERLGEAVSDARHRMVLQDLSWTRTYQFRLSLAALFDDLVAQRALKEVETVRIVAKSENRVSALMLLGWLVTQAEWRMGLELGLAAERATGCDECYVFETPDGRSVTARIEFDEEAAPLGLLELSAPGCVVSVQREAGSAYLQQRLECPGHKLSQSGPADADSDWELVADQLSRGGRNSLFQKVRPAFLELLKAH
jgi:glucose-6-phosphate dehydrogenase assembly protein OpcA